MDPLTGNLISKPNAEGCSAFVCPGTSTPVSRSIHLARLNSAWQGCDQCELRFDTEGLAERTVESAAFIRDQRSEGIRRTEFGVRGPYVNQLNRHSASRLVLVFCDALLRTAVMTSRTTSRAASTAAEHQNGISGGRATLRSLPAKNANTATIATGQSSISDVAADDDGPRHAVIPSVIVGYDGRLSSPDIFVGVTSSIREFGMPVIDVGRSTAASLTEAIRSLPNAAGAVLVTGAGSPSSHTGMDVFDQNGDPVPVVWKDHGIRMRAVSEQSGSDIRSLQKHENVNKESLAAALLPPRTTEAIASAAPLMMLSLPDEWQKTNHTRRIARRSGAHQIVEFELKYRQWLTRWYPDSFHGTVVIQCCDALIAERIQWLSSRTGINFVFRDTQSASGTVHGMFTMIVDEDDRSFCVCDRHGQRIVTSDLVNLINQRGGGRSGHVTAHSDAASGRFWLTDAARPISGNAVEHVRDALATLGLLLRITSN